MTPWIEAMRPLEQYPLRCASTQDLHLALIGRSGLCECDGGSIFHALVRHHGLWDSVIMDKTTDDMGDQLPANAIFKLGNLASGSSNLDTLYVLARDEQSAKKLAQLLRVGEDAEQVSIHEIPDDMRDEFDLRGRNSVIVAARWFA